MSGFRVDTGGGDFVGGDKFSQTGMNNVVNQLAGDEPALAQFVEAVARDLALVDLAAAERARAEQALAALQREAAQPRPDRSRLRAVAASLRTILEGATGDAIAGWLTSIWTP